MVLSSVLIGVHIDQGSAAITSLSRNTIAGTTLGEPPVASIDFPKNGSDFETMTAIRIDGTSSYDPDGGTLTYNWLADPVPEQWGHPPGEPEDRMFFQTRIKVNGTYKITLIVTDEENLNGTTFILIHMVREAGKETTAPITTVETTETSDKDILTVRPNFLPGYSVIAAMFALLIPVVLKRRRKR